MPKGPEPESRDLFRWAAQALTPCKRFPERCGRREVRGVVLDADGVIWNIDGAIASSVCGPYKKINEETVEGQLGSCHGPQVPRGWEEPKGRPVRVTLLPGLRETLDRLEEMGIKLGVSSLNTEGSVKGLLAAFGLLDRFTLGVKDNWDPKEKSVRAISEASHIGPCDLLFVDDTMANVEAVSKMSVLSLHMGQDIQKIGQLLDFLK